MSRTTDTQTAKTTGDVVLQEIWRIRVGDFFSLSAIWGEGWGEVIPCSTDVERLFADARKRKSVSQPSHRNA